jgi:hypothetical protein
MRVSPPTPTGASQRTRSDSAPPLSGRACSHPMRAPESRSAACPLRTTSGRIRRYLAGARNAREAAAVQPAATFPQHSGARPPRTSDLLPATQELNSDEYRRRALALRSEVSRVTRRAAGSAALGSRPVPVLEGTRRLLGWPVPARHPPRRHQ